MRSSDWGDSFGQNKGNGWGVQRNNMSNKFAQGDNFGDDDGGNGSGDSTPVGHPDGQRRYGWEDFGSDEGNGPA